MPPRIGRRWTEPSGRRRRIRRDCTATACLTNAIAVGPKGLVAVGASYPSGDPSDLDAAVFESADGVTWTQLPTDPSFKAATMGKVVAGGSGLVSVGNSRDGSLVAWTSRMAMSGPRYPPLPALSSGEVRGLIPTPSGLVAVGRSGGSAAVWMSADGVSWTRAPDSDALKGSVMNAVAEVGPMLVAVGKDGSGAAAWSSPDGVTWTRLPSSDSFKGAEMTSVVAGGPGVVAVGTNQRSEVQVWVGPTP